MIKTRFFAIVIGFFLFVNGMMICLGTGKPGPVPTPVGWVVPSLNPDLSVIMYGSDGTIAHRVDTCPGGVFFQKDPKTHELAGVTAAASGRIKRTGEGAPPAPPATNAEAWMRTKVGVAAQVEWFVKSPAPEPRRA